MKNITKTIIVALITLVLIASAYPLLGCCSGGCGGCCGGDTDDESEDYDNDGSSSYEEIPTNLGNTQAAQQQTARTEAVCSGSIKNTLTATASKSATGSGYSYSYSFTIKACGSNLGYSVTLEGLAPTVIDSGVAVKGKETTGSKSHTSSESYTELCIKTGDSSIGNNGNYCVPFT